MRQTRNLFLSLRTRIHFLLYYIKIILGCQGFNKSINKIGQFVKYSKQRDQDNHKALIIGVKARRSYQKAGLFQFGGLSVFGDILTNYRNDLDEFTYEIIVQNNNGTHFVKDVAENDLKLIVKKNVF